MDVNKLPSVAFLFAGQGNPTVGMGADLWDLNDTTKKIWDCASDISGIDIRRLCLKGPMNKLVQTTHQQIAVTAINVTLYTLFYQQFNDKYPEKFADINIVGFCGHSVGEYAALYATGAITLPDLFKIIQFRSKLMDDLSKVNKGTMQAVKGVDYHNISQLIVESGIELDVCCDNTRYQQVIGGTVAALREFTPILADSGYDSIKLGVSGAWHTRLMAGGVQQMRDFLADIEIKSPLHEVLMNVTGLPEANPAVIKENLALHLTHTVKWADSMACFLNHPTPVLLVEISNKAYLGHMLNDFDGFSPEMFLHCRKI